MLDLKLIRENPDLVRDKLATRSGSYDIQPLLQLDEQRRSLEQERSRLQARGNEIGKLVGQKMRDQLRDQFKNIKGSLPSGSLGLTDTSSWSGASEIQTLEIQTLKDEGNQVKAKLSDLEPQEKELKAQIEALVLTLPNLPSDTTPIGKDETENVEVRRWGDEYKPQPAGILPHWEIAEKLGILNTERATKIAQTRFVALLGAGAALERALISFMLDRQTAAGYLEVLPPLLVNTQSLTATGQLPKFAEESFQCKDDDLWLAPTSEVALVNLYRDEVLSANELPLHHCAYTPCFRREAGSYGRDTRGLIRLHQFNKVELVKLVHPETSEQEHEALVQNAEAILQALKLPYRVVELCTGDMGFGAAKCYDLEVWLPAADSYREISSCSNMWDFQARRGNIRFKEAGKKGTEFVHTLNGSGLAIGRTMAAVLENYQQSDGTVSIPDVLQPFLGRSVL